MSEQKSIASLNRYRVEVGHAAVHVESHCVQDAVKEARRRFCLEMPRLWDVIQTMDATRFRVQLLR